MDENRKTVIFCSVAIGLALLAFLVAPRRIVPESFVDQGQPFFPKFDDPNSAASLEVVNFDEESGRSIPFRVTSRENLWSIPSHHNYPADGKEQLSKTAAGIISIERDVFRTRNSSEYESCGVLDPLDQSNAGLTGRGQRITVKGPNETILADLIVGNDVPGKPGFKFVRVPDEKGVYAAKFDVEISTKFEDWIDTDLLRVNIRDISHVVIDDYSVNEQTRSIDKRDEIDFRKDGLLWTAKGIKKNHEVDSISMNNLLKAIDELSIVGVRPKPQGLSQQLAGTQSDMKMSQIEMMSLQRKGFFFSTDGQMLSNEGELHLTTNEGVLYMLRFGEVLFGSGPDSDIEVEDGNGENRYLFVTTQVDRGVFVEPTKPSDQSLAGKADSLLTPAEKENKEKLAKWNEWQTKFNNAERLSSELNTRFADWYYVISAKSFDDLHLSRDQLIIKKDNS